MKKYQKEAREIEKLKKQLKNTRSSVERTKDSKLWNHEAGIRKKIRKLNEMSIKHSKEFGEVYDGYLRLLDIVSERILRNYNLQKRTRFYFEEVIGSNREAYIS